MDLRVQRVRSEAAQRTRDQPQTRPIVDGRLVLGENDQGGTRLIQTGIHAARELHAPRQRQANVYAVAHAVRDERAADLPDDLLVRGDVGGGGMGRITVPDGLLDTLGASAADRSGHRS